MSVPFPWRWSAVPTFRMIELLRSMVDVKPPPEFTATAVWLALPVPTIVRCEADTDGDPPPGSTLSPRAVAPVRVMSTSRSSLDPTCSSRPKFVVEMRSRRPVSWPSLKMA